MSLDPRQQATRQVAPPAASPPPAARGGEWANMLAALLVVPLLVCAFELTTSLTAEHLHGNHTFLLGAGLTATLLLPLWLGFVLRRVGRRKRRQPSSLVAIALVNLLLLAGLGLGVPAASKRAIAAHGSWWVADLVTLAGGDAKSPPVRATRRIFSTLADQLPGAREPRPARGRRGKEIARATVPPPPPEPIPAPPPEPIPAPPAAPGERGESVKVKFERRGSSILVPVTIRGPRAEVRAKMIFDTGATFSTIDRETAEKLGLSIDPRDPTIVTHTANGKARRTLKVVEGIRVASARVDGGLAVSVCDPCASGRAIGLLGLNFSRHFAVTFDHEAGQLTLKPRSKLLSPVYDIRSFVAFKASRGLRRGPQMTVKATLHNQAPRALRGVRVVAEVAVPGKPVAKLWTEVRHVPARGSAPLTLQGLLPDGAKNSYRLKLDQAHW